MRKFSTNISCLGQGTHLKFRQLSSLFIVYNITISWLKPLNGFLFHFIIFFCVTMNTFYWLWRETIYPFRRHIPLVIFQDRSLRAKTFSSMQHTGSRLQYFPYLQCFHTDQMMNSMHLILQNSRDVHSCISSRLYH